MTRNLNDSLIIVRIIHLGVSRLVSELVVLIHVVNLGEENKKIFT